MFCPILLDHRGPLDIAKEMEEGAIQLSESAAFLLDSLIQLLG